MKNYQNIFLIIGVVVLIAIPFWTVKKPVPAPGGNAAETFRGTDDQAKDMIKKIAPEYKPWFKSLLESPGSEVSAMLFAIQAAIGAGFIGYYLGVSVTRAKIRREQEKEGRC